MRSLASASGLAAAACRRGRGKRRRRLPGAHACPGQTGFECSTLTVPLDYSGRIAGTLRLAVAARRGGTAPRGDLLVLTGGPGQPGASFIARLRAASAPWPAVPGRDDRPARHRGEALRCPALQPQMGFSDLQPPTAAAVRACAAAIGPKRAFFGTDDVVRDLDRLRQALGVSRLAIDGTSYGTYVAERYALAYPGHVSRLVLDSVVPHEASGQLETQAFPRVAQVLRNVCGAVPTTSPPSSPAITTGRSCSTRSSPSACSTRPTDGLAQRFTRPGGETAAASTGCSSTCRGGGVRACGRAEPGPSREHALRGLALAVGRLVGAARRSLGGAEALRGLAAGERARTVRPGDRGRQRDHAAVPLLAADCADAAARRAARRSSRLPCCSPATATSRRRSPGRRPS